MFHADCAVASIIFELIKGEMQYVRDLENIEVVRARPFRRPVP